MKPAVIEQSQDLGPFKVSDGMLLTVAFPKSRSKQYSQEILVRTPQI
jgi:hypothetical protein